MRDKHDFLLEDKHQVFYKQVVSFLLVITRYAQSIQNSKFVMSLQYLEKEGRDEVEFLQHQTSLQVDPINLGEHGQACPNYPK